MHAIVTNLLCRGDAIVETSLCLCPLGHGGVKGAQRQHHPGTRGQMIRGSRPFVGQLAIVARDEVAAHGAGSKTDVGVNARQHTGVFADSPREMCTLEHAIQRFWPPCR